MTRRAHTEHAMGVLAGISAADSGSRGGPFASMRPRREVLLTTFADPSTFPSVFEVPAESGGTPGTEAPEAAQVTPDATVEQAETHPVEAVEIPAPAVPTFAELGVAPELVRVLSREG